MCTKRPTAATSACVPSGTSPITGAACQCSASSSTNDSVCEMDLASLLFAFLSWALIMAIFTRTDSIFVRMAADAVGAITIGTSVAMELSLKVDDCNEQIEEFRCA